jgi:hypothetical protein
LSPGFERFQTLQMPAKRKIEYFKLHKSLYDNKLDEENIMRESQNILENKMPIYDKKEIIKIKNGDIYPVLTYNAKVRPNSASSRVL